MNRVPVPFKLPVRVEPHGSLGSALVAADCELVCVIGDATDAELQAIVACINAQQESA